MVNRMSHVPPIRIEDDFFDDEPDLQEDKPPILDWVGVIQFEVDGSDNYVLDSSSDADFPDQDAGWDVTEWVDFDHHCGDIDVGS